MILIYYSSLDSAASPSILLPPRVTCSPLPLPPAASWWWLYGFYPPPIVVCPKLFAPPAFPPLSVMDALSFYKVLGASGAVVRERSTPLPPYFFFLLFFRDALFL